jgi:hypothetical protein
MNSSIERPPACLSDLKNSLSSKKSSCASAFRKHIDERVEERITQLRNDSEMKKKAFDDIMASSPAFEFAPEETPFQLSCFWAKRFKGQFTLECRADNNVCLYRQLFGDTTGDGKINLGIGERIVISREGNILIHENIDLDDDNHLFFGVPISYNPDAPYENTPEQINVQHRGSPDITCYHIYNGVVVPDTTNPTLEKGPNKTSEVVVHFGTETRAVLREENDYFIHCRIRDMYTQEKRYFIVEATEGGDGIHYSPISLHEEIYFLARDESESRIIHARSGKVVFSTQYHICDVASASDYIAIGANIEDKYIVMFLN